MRMNKFPIIVLLVLLTAGWTANVQFRIVDESGKPLSGMPCDVRFARELSISPKVDIVDGISDAKGFFRAKGETIAAPTCVVRGEGYYKTLFPATENDMGTFVIQKRGAPIPMVFGGSQICRFPYPLEKAEYDCFLCDFLPPYGKGNHADFTIFLKGGVRDIPNLDARDESYWYDTRLVTNEGGGFVVRDSIAHSDYRYSRVAGATWKWNHELHFWCKGLRGPTQESEYDNNKKHIVFKIVRKIGDVEHLYYGVIKEYSVFIGIPNKSRQIDFATMINPNPDDPNIEFDGHALKPQDPKAPVAKAGEK